MHKNHVLIGEVMYFSVSAGENTSELKRNPTLTSRNFLIAYKIHISKISNITMVTVLKIVDIAVFLFT